MQNALTTIEKWEKEWKDFPLPAIQIPSDNLDRVLHAYLPNGENLTLLEIGCAPGRWMAYFNKNLGYRVSGIEYAEQAAALTRHNLEIQSIPAEIMVEDFWRLEPDDKKFDVVFSSGFIEHFKNLPEVIEKIGKLSRRYVVTLIPNLFGINGLISKSMRPRIYAQHTPIDKEYLEFLHASENLKTVFCNYVGGIKFIMPGAHNLFFEKHYWLRRVFNLPVIFFNLISEKVSQSIKYALNNRYFSHYLLYIGEKRSMNNVLSIRGDFSRRG